MQCFRSTQYTNDNVQVHVDSTMVTATVGSQIYPSNMDPVNLVALHRQEHSLAAVEDPALDRPLLENTVFLRIVVVVPFSAQFLYGRTRRCHRHHLACAKAFRRIVPLLGPDHPQIDNYANRRSPSNGPQRATYHVMTMCLFATSMKWYSATVRGLTIRCRG